jgi:hypothetical protein
MFEHIALRRAEGGDPISVGEVVEALLYYQRVHVVVDRGTLFAWLRHIGPDHLLSLLQRSDISAVYCEEMLGAQTDFVGPLQVHNLVAITLSGHEGVGKLKSSEDRLIYELERLPIDKSVARRFAKQFLRRVPVRKFSGSHFAAQGITELAKRDLLDSEFTKLAVRQLVALSPGGHDPGNNFRFDIVNSDLGMYVFHDIDLAMINAKRASLSPAVEALTVAHLLSQMQDASADLAIASFYGGDFVTSQAASAIIKVRHESVLRRTELNTDARKQFVEIVLPDSPTFAEVVNAGERSLKEALTLVDQAVRFKHWLRTAHPDEGLVRTYMRDISSEGWVQRLPTKSLRYMLTLALDATNPAARLLAGFADNFLIEKLLGGWRPNHFVNARLQPFIRGG